jgi:hypothetical protein
MAARARIVASALAAGLLVAGFGGGLVSGARAGSSARTTAAAAPSLVAPAAAASELATMWRVREKALSDDDVAALKRVDTGAALDRDVGLTLYVKGLGTSSLRVQRHLGRSVVVVPYQTRYPISFLAFVETSSEFQPKTQAAATVGYETDTLVFAKSAASEPWRVALATRQLGGFGFTPPRQLVYAPPAPSSSWISPTGALRALAQFDQESVEESSAPSVPMDGGPWTTGAYSAFSSEGPNGITDNGGVRRVHTYYVSPNTDGVYHFDAMGADLVCGAVRANGTLTPSRPGGYLFQNPTRTNWGGWLAPGRYGVIRTSELNQVCLSIPATRDNGIDVVSGEYDLDEWAATGAHSTTTTGQLASIRATGGQHRSAHSPLA